MRVARCPYTVRTMRSLSLLLGVLFSLALGSTPARAQTPPNSHMPEGWWLSAGAALYVPPTSIASMRLVDVGGEVGVSWFAPRAPLVFGADVQVLASALTHADGTDDALSRYSFGVRAGVLTFGLEAGVFWRRGFADGSQSTGVFGLLYASSGFASVGLQIETDFASSGLAEQLGTHAGFAFTFKAPLQLYAPPRER